MNSDPLADTGRPRGYDLEIRQLKARAVAMGEWALGMVHDGWRAFNAGDFTAAQAVLDRGTELDRLDEDIEHAAIAFLVLRQPTAGDLRTAAGLLKITTHLDRVGRLGFDMARITTAGPPKEPEEVREVLDRMDTVVESMVLQSLEALGHDRADLARELFRRDDEVDQLHRDANRIILRELRSKANDTSRLAADLLVARHFERIADNACKVGEKTVYALTGQRRSEYLPRHRYTPYALETPTTTRGTPEDPPSS
ncbi:MAG TPA: phosphate signaling complex protein PhoU [Thermoplasmata archaeon]|jgi:phosphate transport system protein